MVLGIAYFHYFGIKRLQTRQNSHDNPYVYRSLVPIQPVDIESGLLHTDDEEFFPSLLLSQPAHRPPRSRVRSNQIECPKTTQEDA